MIRKVLPHSVPLEPTSSQYRRDSRRQFRYRNPSRRLDRHRLKQNRFRGRPQVVPYLSDVALADFESLKRERFDSIVLSNVMEHIPDDAGAVRRCAQILVEGGKVLILVPALPAIFGALDEAQRLFGKRRSLRVCGSTIARSFTS